MRQSGYDGAGGSCLLLRHDRRLQQTMIVTPLIALHWRGGILQSESQANCSSEDTYDPLYLPAAISPVTQCGATAAPGSLCRKRAESGSVSVVSPVSDDNGRSARTGFPSLSLSLSHSLSVSEVIPARLGPVLFSGRPMTRSDSASAATMWVGQLGR